MSTLDTGNVTFGTDTGNVTFGTDTGNVTFRTKGGVVVHRRSSHVARATAVSSLAAALDERRGALFSSSYEYPGRYTRWDLGFADPPIMVSYGGADYAVSARAVAAHPYYRDAASATLSIVCRGCWLGFGGWVIGLLAVRGVAETSAARRALPGGRITSSR